MAYETIKYEVADQILTITLNRPDKLNAFNATMQRELIEAFDAADKDDDVRAIIVTGPAASSAPAPIFPQVPTRSTATPGADPSSDWPTAASTTAIPMSATAAAR